MPPAKIYIGSKRAELRVHGDEEKLMADPSLAYLIVALVAAMFGFGGIAADQPGYSAYSSVLLIIYVGGIVLSRRTES